MPNSSSRPSFLPVFSTSSLYLANITKRGDDSLSEGAHSTYLIAPEIAHDEQRSELCQEEQAAELGLAHQLDLR